MLQASRSAEVRIGNILDNTLLVERVEQKSVEVSENDDRLRELMAVMAELAVGPFHTHKENKSLENIDTESQIRQLLAHLEEGECQAEIVDKEGLDLWIAMQLGDFVADRVGKRIHGAGDIDAMLLSELVDTHLKYEVHVEEDLLDLRHAA